MEEKIITVNNVRMTPREAKILDGWKVFDAEPVSVENPYSKISVLLEPEAVAMYDIIKGCEITRSGEDIFYAARDVFRRNWPREYKELID